MLTIFSGGGEQQLRLLSDSGKSFPRTTLQLDSGDNRSILEAFMLLCCAVSEGGRIMNTLKL